MRSVALTSWFQKLCEGMGISSAANFNFLTAQVATNHCVGVRVDAAAARHLYLGTGSGFKHTFLCAPLLFGEDSAIFDEYFQKMA